MKDVDDIPIKVDVKVDTKDAAVVFEKLLDVLKAPFQQWTNNKAPIALAKAETKSAIIRAEAARPLSEALGISEEDAASLLMRTEQRELYEKIRHQQNLEKIVNGATEHVSYSNTEKVVDKEWTMEFLDQCKNIGNEHLQHLWSRILAGEISTPGTYSKRTLSFIRTLSKQEAEAFTKFCSLVWSEQSLGSFCLNPTDKPGLDQFDVTYADLVELDSMGLIRFDNNYTGFTLGSKETIEFNYFRESLAFKVPKSKKEIRMPIIMLTKLGKELMGVAGAEKNTEYRDTLIAHLIKLGLKKVRYEYESMDYLDIPAFLRRQAD